jgi:hypothetical protein
MSDPKYIREKSDGYPPYTSDWHFYRDKKEWLEGGDSVDKSLFLRLADVDGDHTKSRLDATR